MTFEVIQGGGETVDLQPKLVKRAEDGKICMQITYREFEATLPLPEHLAGATEDRLQAFFEAVVPEITENLMRMARQDRRKLRRQAKQ